MTMDSDSQGFYIVCVPLLDEVHQIPGFESVDDIHHWLLTDWPSYHDWVTEGTDWIVQDDQLWVDRIDETGARFRDSIVYTDCETGQLVIG